MGTLTWSKAKRKVTGQLAMTHALASHALMTLNFNYLEISQFTLDFYHKLVLGATSITSLCLGPKTSRNSLFLHRTLYVVKTRP